MYGLKFMKSAVTNNIFVAGYCKFLHLNMPLRVYRIQFIYVSDKYRMCLVTK